MLVEVKQFSSTLDSENEPYRFSYHCRVFFYRDRSDCHHMTKTSTHGFGGSVAYSGKAYQRTCLIACSVYVFFSHCKVYPMHVNRR